jgi:hypothetical protein
VEDGVGDRLGLIEPEAAALHDLVGDVDDVAQHREQVFLDAADHLAVDEGRGRRVVDLQPDPPGVTHDLHVELAVPVEQLLGVVAVAAGVEHGERALAEQRVHARVAAAAQQALDLRLGQVLEAAPRPHARVDDFRQVDDGFHAGDGPPRQGRISMGVLSFVSSQSSTMSEFDTAMQPSVQSRLW